MSGGFLRVIWMLRVIWIYNPAVFPEDPDPGEVAALAERRPIAERLGRRHLAVLTLRAHREEGGAVR